MPGALAHAVVLFQKCGREHVAQRAAQRLRARRRVHHFHLRVPRLDAVFQVHRQHADADGLDDVLVEFLQPLVLRRLAAPATCRGARSAPRCRCSRPASPAIARLRWRGSRLPPSCPARARQSCGSSPCRECSSSGPAGGWPPAPSGVSRTAWCGVVEEQVAGLPLRPLHMQEVEVKPAGVCDAK